MLKVHVTFQRTLFPTTERDTMYWNHMNINWNREEIKCSQ